MKQRKQNITRIIVGLLLVVLAAGITYIIKELLASRNPADALPVIRVDYSGTPLPAEHYTMDSYSWRFLTMEKSWEEPDRGKWIGMKAAPVLPGAPLDISFSFPCETMRVTRAEGEAPGEEDYEEVVGSLTTPMEPGIYTYKVVGNWGLKGQVLYYIKVDVRA